MAKRAYLGAAQAVPQVDTVTLADTWATGDTITLTINYKSLTLTVGTDATFATILDNLVAMLSGSGSLSAAYTVTGYGNTIGEFAQLSYTEDGTSVLTVTGKSDGRPFTMTASEVTAGDGTATRASDTSPTGPHHFDNPDNWTANTVPVDGDDIIFDERAANDMLYALDQSANVDPGSVETRPGFSKKIGLPSVCLDTQNYPFDEYLEQFFKFQDSAGTCDVTINSPKSTRIQIDANTGQATFLVKSTGGRVDSQLPPCLLKGTHPSNAATIQKGDVGFALAPEETTTLSTLNMSYYGNKNKDVLVECGSGVTLGTVTKTGGQLITNCAIGTALTQTGGDWIHYDGAVASATLYAGQMLYRASSTIDALIVGAQGIADFSEGTSRTVTTCTVVKGYTIKDPIGTVTWTNGIACTHNRLEEGTLESAPNLTWTPS